MFLAVYTGSEVQANLHIEVCLNALRVKYGYTRRTLRNQVKFSRTYVEVDTFQINHVYTCVKVQIKYTDVTTDLKVQCICTCKCNNTL